MGDNYGKTATPLVHATKAYLKLEICFDVFGFCFRRTVETHRLCPHLTSLGSISLFGFSKLNHKLFPSD